MSDYVLQGKLTDDVPSHLPEILTNVCTCIAFLWIIVPECRGHDSYHRMLGIVTHCLPADTFDARYGHEGRDCTFFACLQA